MDHAPGARPRPTRAPRAKTRGRQASPAWSPSDSPTTVYRCDEHYSSPLPARPLARPGKTRHPTRCGRGLPRRASACGVGTRGAGRHAAGAKAGRWSTTASREAPGPRSGCPAAGRPQPRRTAQITIDDLAAELGKHDPENRAPRSPHAARRRPPSARGGGVARVSGTRARAVPPACSDPPCNGRPAMLLPTQG